MIKTTIAHAQRKRVDERMDIFIVLRAFACLEGLLNSVITCSARWPKKGGKNKTIFISCKKPQNQTLSSKKKLQRKLRVEKAREHQEGFPAQRNCVKRNVKYVERLIDSFRPGRDSKLSRRFLHWVVLAMWFPFEINEDEWITKWKGSWINDAVFRDLIRP